MSDPSSHAVTGQMLSSPDDGSSRGSSPTPLLRTPLTFSTSITTHTHRPLSAEALVELQVQNAGLRKRLEGLSLENEALEKRQREKDEELRRKESLNQDLENQLRHKQFEIDGLKDQLSRRDTENRSKQTAFQVQMSELECTLSTKRNRIHELEEQVQRANVSSLHANEISEQLRRQILELKQANDAVLKDREERRQREQALHQEYKDRMDQQRHAYMQEQEKLQRSHSQASDFLNLKIQSLEKRLEDERAESALQVKDIEDRLREYEDALDELEIDHEQKLKSAAQEARSIWEAETAEMTANYAKCREREESLRERLEEAERSKREEVLKIMVEWEGVYKELETLYFAARDEAERKTQMLERANRDLDVANETVRQLSDQQHRYTQNIEWMKVQLDASRSTGTKTPKPSSLTSPPSAIKDRFRLKEIRPDQPIFSSASKTKAWSPLRGGGILLALTLQAVPGRP